MPHQLTFDLPSRTALGRDDFFVSPANALALTTVEDWANWPAGKLVLVGPKGAGKTHLVHVWAAKTGALVLDGPMLAPVDIAQIVEQNRHIAVENADQIGGDSECESQLFHLHNLLLAEGGRLLVTAKSMPAQWGLTLPDLLSRMQASNVTTLNPPDDALLAAVMVKLFSDRQIAVLPNVIAYLVSRMERSFDGAQHLVAALDSAAFSQGRPITQRFAATVLDKLSPDAP
jgi:chromosomal replication initiation ATPase DnaA